MLKKIIFVILVVFMSSNLSAEDRKAPSMTLDPICAEELNGASEAYFNCTKSVEITFKQKFSPECLSELKSKNKLVSAACQQEQARLIIASNTDLHKCAQMLPLGLKCREQVESALSFVQAIANNCAYAIQKISHICGTDLEVNKKCYEEHRAELGATCGEDK